MSHSIDSWVSRIIRENKKDDKLAEMIRVGSVIYLALPTYKEVDNIETYHKLMQRKHDFVYNIVNKVRYDEDQV